MTFADFLPLGFIALCSIFLCCLISIVISTFIFYVIDDNKIFMTKKCFLHNIRYFVINHDYEFTYKNKKFKVTTKKVTIDEPDEFLKGGVYYTLYINDNIVCIVYDIETLMKESIIIKFNKNVKPRQIAIIMKNAAKAYIQNLVTSYFSERDNKDIDFLK